MGGIVAAKAEETLIAQEELPASGVGKSSSTPFEGVAGAAGRERVTRLVVRAAARRPVMAAVETRATTLVRDPRGGRVPW